MALPYACIVSSMGYDRLILREFVTNGKSQLPLCLAGRLSEINSYFAGKKLFTLLFWAVSTRPTGQGNPGTAGFILSQNR